MQVTLSEMADGGDARFREPLCLERTLVALPAGFPGAGAKGKGQVCFAQRGRKEAQAGWKVIRSHCPTRGNSNFYEHLNDNTSS